MSLPCTDGRLDGHIATLEEHAHQFETDVTDFEIASLSNHTNIDQHVRHDWSNFAWALLKPSRRMGSAELGCVERELADCYATRPKSPI